MSEDRIYEMLDCLKGSFRNYAVDQKNYFHWIKSIEEYIINQDKEIERLNKLNDANYKSFIDANNIINGFEKWLISWIENEQYCFLANNPKDRCRREVYEEVLHHLRELKGSESNE